MPYDRLAVLGIVAHGAACALFVLLAALLWRDRRASSVGRLSAALAAGAAAHAAYGVPGLAASGPTASLWEIPLGMIAAATPAMFWLWARAAFDDGFAPRPWQALPWLTMASCDWLAMRGGAAASRAAQGLPWLALGLVALTAAESLATWRGDLIAGRRRLRLVVLTGSLLYIAADNMPALRGLPAGAAAGAAGLVQPLALCALALWSAWRLLAVHEGASVLATPAAPPATLRGMAAGAIGTSPAAPPDPPAVLPTSAPDHALLRRLEQMMTVERVYRQEGLTIGALAQRLGITEQRLRRAINEGLGHRNFNAFVNGARIAEAKAALADPAQRAVPVLTIALDAGFQSIGPFNRAFKAATGMTPSEYRATHADMPPQPGAFSDIGKAG